jgi:nucleoside-diphosphate-sugar epimerase
MLSVFTSGGTGYLGRPLAAALLARGHRVRLLARPGSEGKAPAGPEVVPGDPLRAETFDPSGRGIADRRW